MPYLPKPVLIAATAGLAFSLQACGAKAPVRPIPAAAPYAEAILYDGTGKRTGLVTLTTEGTHLAGTIEVSGGLTPGEHGMHIHTVGKCTLPDFTSAGGHLNPTDKEHGLDNPRGSHGGDLPMLIADARGAAAMTFMAHASMADVFDVDGSALIIHAAADDMKTDPSGNSGARVMCGVLYRKAP